MAHASARCPFCKNESISMSSTVLCRQRRLSHIAIRHPEKDFKDQFLESKGETCRAENVDTTGFEGPT